MRKHNAISRTILLGFSWLSGAVAFSSNDASSIETLQPSFPNRLMRAERKVASIVNISAGSANTLRDKDNLTLYSHSHSRWTPIHYDWEAAPTRVFNKLHKSVRHPSARVEYTWRSGLPHKCGNPCVAHCVAGLTKKPATDSPEKRTVVWEQLKRSFARFSENSIVFLVLSIAEIRGTYKDPQEATFVSELESNVALLNPARALFEASNCNTHECLKNESKIGGCHKTGYIQCDLQIGRVGQCMELVEGYEKDHSMRFDFVTRIRADPKDDFIRNVSAFTNDRVYTTRWDGRRCYGGFDWVYIMPRDYASIIGRFRDEATCDLVKNVYKEKGLAELGGYHEDPYYKGGFPCQSEPLGCEAWLAAWMYLHNIPFEPQPLDDRAVARCKQCPKDKMCSVKAGMKIKCLQESYETCSQLATRASGYENQLYCPKSPVLG